MRKCPLCGSEVAPAGSRFSRFSDRDFLFGHCAECNLGVVINPRTDYDNLYDENYYSGLGADPLVNYSGTDFGRELEFEGLLRTAERITTSRGKWLDFGGGLGHFTMYLREAGWDAWSYDEGFAGEQLRKEGLYLEDHNPHQFDVISAIEVLEHLWDPLSVLAQLADLLRPGGILLVTTGNLDKAPSLSRWKYSAVPEVHITFWSPKAYDLALGAVGLDTLGPSNLDARVTQYKIIKNVRYCKRMLLFLAPFWRPLAKLVDRRYGVSEFSIARKA